LTAVKETARRGLPTRWRLATLERAPVAADDYVRYRLYTE
jgi:hypothetical protein